jgi:anaerobic selenocysteine-containing dehydrogenase
MTERIRTSCPRDCYDGCGIVVERVAGRVIRVLGDPDHPVSRGKLCQKCALAYNGAWRDPEARLQHPLRRRSSKPGGGFEAISWDDALAEIAAQLEQTLESHGPESIFHAHYTGTCSLLASEFPLRFFRRLGATEVTPDTICNNAGHEALTYLLGTSVDGFDPKTIADSRCVMIWGANPSASAPHAHAHWLRETAATLIVVDPIRHATAEQADIHLQPFPGTDAALAFGMLHVIRREGLIDEAFVSAHTLGWEEIEPLIDTATPQKTETLTGVPVAAIEAAARHYAAGPSLLWLGQGLQRQPRGGNVMRACAVLPAITGNLGKPGAGICYLNGDGPRNIDGDYVRAAQLKLGPTPTISHMDLADALADRERTRAFFCWNMNVAASAPRQRALRKALSREDLFTVVVDLFQTDTADFADIVLPAASFLEFDDLVIPYFHLYLSAQVKVEDPPGEALPNPEIFRRLSRAMGYAEPELYEGDRAILDIVLSRTGLGFGFDELAERGTIDPFPDPVIRFADGRFPTPSGRVEIASASAEANGHPRVPQPHADARPPDGQFRLLSPASEWLMNDSYGNDANVLRKLGPACIQLNPDDAKALALKEGEAAIVSSQTGQIELRVRCSDSVPRGVALAHKGRWPRLEAGTSNVNVLNAGERSDMGESSSVHGTLVRIAAA